MRLFSRLLFGDLRTFCGAKESFNWNYVTALTDVPSITYVRLESAVMTPEGVHIRHIYFAHWIKMTRRIEKKKK